MHTEGDLPLPIIRILLVGGELDGETRIVHMFSREFRFCKSDGTEVVYRRPEPTDEIQVDLGEAPQFKCDVFILEGFVPNA
jgi:hypothetical protein